MTANDTLLAREIAMAESYLEDLKRSKLTFEDPDCLGRRLRANYDNTLATFQRDFEKHCRDEQLIAFVTGWITRAKAYLVTLQSSVKP